MLLLVVVFCLATLLLLKNAMLLKFVERNEFLSFHMSNREVLKVCQEEKEKKQIDLVFGNEKRKALSTTINLYENVWLKLRSAFQGQETNGNSFFGKHFLVDLEFCESTEEFSTRFSPSSLSEIFRFYEMISAIERRNPLINIVLCVGPSFDALKKAWFLIGCHLTMVLSLGDAIRIFEEIKSSAKTSLLDVLEDGDDILMINGWKALEGAKIAGWIDFDDAFDSGSHRSKHIYIPMYMHYASPVNGSAHIVVPEKFLVFPAPAQLPSGCQWCDSDGSRHFSADFYGELLLDLNVSQVVRIDPVVPGEEDDADIDAEALHNWGLAVHNFHGELSLQQLDRFMTLAQSDSVVAIQYADQKGLSRAGTLMASWMMRHKRFATSDQALSWLRMLVPGASMSLQHDLLRVGSAGSSVAASPKATAVIGPLDQSSPPSPLRCLSLNEETLRRRWSSDPPLALGSPLPSGPGGGGGGGDEQLAVVSTATASIQGLGFGPYSPAQVSARRPRPRTGSLPDVSLYALADPVMVVGRTSYMLT